MYRGTTASSKVMDEGSMTLHVHEQDVDAHGARCQGFTNVFGSGGNLEGFNDVLEALRMAAESVIVDDALVVEDCGCP